MSSSPAELYARFADEALQAGRPDLAAELLALASQPERPRQAAEDPHALAREATRLHAEGRYADAEVCLRRAIKLQPHHAGWYDNLGVILVRQGRSTEALAYFQVALKLQPNDAIVWSNLAHAARTVQPLLAANAFRELIRLRPGDAAPRLTLLDLLLGQDQLDEADAVAREAAAAFPHHPAVQSAVAIALANAGRHQAAVPYFERTVELAPKLADAHSNLAAVYGKLKRWADCERAARHALALDSRLAAAWGNLGNCLRDQGRLEQAETALRQALALAPDNADALGNLGLTLANQGRYGEALPFYDRTLAVRPDHGDARFNRGLAYLTLGDYERGFADYEARWQTENLKGLQPRYPVPEWDGSDPAGRRIFIHTEQGFGDTLQFIRLLPALAARGAHVIMHPPAALQPLLRNMTGIATLLEGDHAEATFDCHCSLMSLPHRLGLRLENLPNQVPYLHAPEAAIQRWRVRLADVPGLKVGMAWQGNPDFPGDRWRSARLEHLSPLAAVPGVTLCSLQVNEARKQIPTVGFPVLDLGGELAPDFGDTAGLMMNLDLVISTCTSVAHLAGALARPLWVVLSANPDWRWLRDRADSPWYPTARLFRQPQLGAWESVYTSVAQALAELQQTGVPG